MPTYTRNLGIVRDFLNRSRTRLVDVVLMSDSNGLYQAAGWDTGLRRLLARMYPDACYSTGLFGCGESQGQGLGHGPGGTSDGTNSDTIRYNAYRGSALDARAGAAPAGISGVWSTSFDTGNSSGNRNQVIEEVYWVSTASPTANPAGTFGMRLYDTNAVGYSQDATHQLQYQVWAAKWTTADAPVLIDQNVQLLNATGGHQSFVALTTHGQPSTVLTAVPFTADWPTGYSAPNAQGLIARWFGTNTLATTYPFMASFQRVVRKNATAGWGFQTFYGVGGSKAAELDSYLSAMGTTKLQHYRDCMCSQQGIGSNHVLCWIIIGANDYLTVSAATFKSNLASIISRVRTAWGDTELYPGNVLRFVLQVDHPLGYGTNDTQAAYRQVAAELAAENPTDVASLDIHDVVTIKELTDKFGSGLVPRYDANNVSGSAHLAVGAIAQTDESYTAVALRLADLIADSGNASSTSSALVPLRRRPGQRFPGLERSLSWEA
jgi:hypothetical protein